MIKPDCYCVFLNEGEGTVNKGIPFDRSESGGCYKTFFNTIGEVKAFFVEHNLPYNANTKICKIVNGKYIRMDFTSYESFMDLPSFCSRLSCPYFSKICYDCRYNYGLKMHLEKKGIKL